MKKYRAIKIQDIKRTYYKTAEDLASHLAGIIHKNNAAISLFTDYKWHTDGCVISPYAGYATTLSIGYEGPFTEEELMKALKQEGITPNRVSGQSAVYVLHTKDVGEVPTFNMGCEHE